MKKLTLLLSLFTMIFLTSCDKCKDVDCGEGGSCDSETGKCVCEDGWSGDKCETFDPCYATECQNGGECVDGTCDCPLGWDGENCETEAPCELITCENGGTCVDGTCDCPDGYGGDNCEIVLTPKSFLIKEVKTNKFPIVNSSSQSWDANDGPDLYIAIIETNIKREVFTPPVSEVVENATLGSTYTFTNKFDSKAITAFDEKHQISLYDEDGTIDEQMVWVNIRWSDYMDGANPNPFIIDKSNQYYEVYVEYTWE